MPTLLNEYQMEKVLELFDATAFINVVYMKKIRKDACLGILCLDFLFYVVFLKRFFPYFLTQNEFAIF